ncbi:Maf family protein [Nesterenkonia lutea]|uniref:Nucleoside triphosphate pyrophosphatase n=1 Tax=Nesterenkonia lutea TaxID=272919 RepID=A0ABR9JB09_9MICC|nr:nucleoside triphosphate pyrophosphatase [Nesterenkonia lutea]MBE1523117.1 septum formation protein [Nesterenkonia lutea]
MTRLVLGSASTSRARILNQAGIGFTVRVSHVDEPAAVAAAGARAEGQAITPAAEAQLLADLKAAAVVDLPEVRAAAGTTATVVLGCDSVFELDGVSYGKPYEVGVAVARWRLMRGRTGVLHSGHTLIDASTGRRAQRTVSTLVSFGEPTDAEIQLYAESGEPLHCAGAFTIDGRGSAFIEKVEGDHLSVIGVSPAALRAMLAELGQSITDFWSAPSPAAHH